MNLKNRQQILVIGALAAAGLFLCDRLVIEPLTNAWKARSERIAELEDSVRKGVLLTERDATIRGRWSEMRANSLPQNASVAEDVVLQAIGRWAQESRLSSPSIRPTWRRINEQYTLLECRADAFGSIEAISRFLYHLERDPLPIRIETMEIAARDNDGRQLSINLSFSALLLNQPTL